MKRTKITLFTAVLVLATLLVANNFGQSETGIVAGEFIDQTVIESPDIVKPIEITSEDTYSTLMTDSGVDASVSISIYDAAKDVYDLASIREGRSIYLTYDKNDGELKQLMYPISTEEELFVTRFVELVEVEPEVIENEGVATKKSVTSWRADRRPIQYDIKTKTASGVIDSSLYEAGLASGLEDAAIIALADVFQWTIDYVYDTRVGDNFKFIYEERYRDGKYVMPGNVLAAKYFNNGVEYQAYYFEEDEETVGYFDLQGDSMQKIFLKAPLAFKYISSGFTTGSRYVQAFNVSTGHRAIDYAAVYGTPIRAVGDGTVISAGWNSQGYGNRISVRHSSTFTTNYAHLSRIAVRSGQKVTQGQTIGYVGSTGFSTGPHLHYEMVKYGTKINPLAEVFPSDKAVAPENLERYFESISEYKEILNS